MARTLQGKGEGTPDLPLAAEAGALPWLSLVFQKTEAVPVLVSPRPSLGPILASSPGGWGQPRAFWQPRTSSQGPTSGRAGGARHPGQCGQLQVGPGSFLIVIRGVGEGKLEAVGLGQQQADVLVIPVGCGQVLEKKQQLLGRKRQVQVRGGDPQWRAGDPGKLAQPAAAPC